MHIQNPYIQYMYSYPHKTAYRDLGGVNLKDYQERFAGAGHGLYVHIPFCQSKCGYCNLFSVTGQGREEMDRYLDGMERQAGQYGQILAEAEAGFSHLVIGGGTPLLLDEDQLQRVFDLTRNHFSFGGEGDRVIETAPNQTEKEKIKRLKQLGVTRVSMGIQSFQEEELKTLGRSHSPKKARKAVEILKSADFPCINLDFIYGIPGQTVESLLKTLREGVGFLPEEIFLYPLYVKHGAAMERDGLVPEPDQARIQYREAAGYLKSRGYRQDSMRRFVRQKKGVRRKREFSDCGFAASLALGCGGRSYAGNLHFCTPYAITMQGCLKQLKEYEETKDYTRITHGIFLSEEEEKRRYVIRHLFIRPGLDTCQYTRLFGTQPCRDFPCLVGWIEEEYLEYRNGFLTLTETGLELSDYLGPKLISPEIQKKMEEWDHEQGCPHNGSLSGELKKL